jgi:hypothetical protein
MKAGYARVSSAGGRIYNLKSKKGSKYRDQVIPITILCGFSQPYINKIIKKMRSNEL